MTTTLTPVRARVAAVRWDDPAVDDTGADVAGLYVEMFWLPFLGPTATWLARRLVACLDSTGTPVLVDVAELGAALGVGPSCASNAPVPRALARLRRFGVTRHRGTLLDVRTRLAPLSAAQLRRLPAGLQDDHATMFDPRQGLLV